MAQKMQFDLVAPERRLASVAVDAVQIPATDGDLTAMADHAPLITTLRPGILRVQGGEGAAETAYFVTGGFADVAGPSVTVLAEQALPVSEVTTELMEGFIAEARAPMTRRVPPMPPTRPSMSRPSVWRIWKQPRHNWRADTAPVQKIRVPAACAGALFS